MQSLFQLLHMGVCHKELGHDAVREICQGEADKGPLVSDLSGLTGDDLTSNTDLPNGSLDLTDRRNRIVEITAIDQVCARGVLEGPGASEGGASSLPLLP